jgi:signal transduction histidine kinase
VRSVGEAVIDAVERVALENGGHDRSNTVMAMLYSFENEAYALNDYIENTVEHDVNAALGKHMASIDAARDRARVQTAMFAGGASFIGAAIAVGVAVGFVAARKRSALLTEEMLLADERVRHDLSFQLHNQMGQDLSALKIFLGVLRTRHGSEEELVDSTAAVDRLVETMHATCDVLCPPGLEDLGLGATMKTLVAEYARMGFTVEANIADPCACSPEIALTVYRVAQEALTNAAKHASARHVEVALSRDGDRVCLSVKDDGNGFDTESAGRVREGYRKGGFGLASIHERLAIIGGSLRVTSRLGSGTALTAHVPAYIGGAR